MQLSPSSSLVRRGDEHNDYAMIADTISPQEKGEETTADHSDELAAGGCGRLVDWMGWLGTKLGLSPSQQPYQRLDTHSAPAITSPAIAKEDDGATFSTLRFFQFCGSG